MMSNTSRAASPAARPGSGTTAVHGPPATRQKQPYCSLTTPIVQTATYTFADTADLVAYQEAKMWGGAGERREYGRYGNPTVRDAERRLAALEAPDEAPVDALLFPSGMAALTQVMLTMLPTGSHVILTDDSYRKTRQFCETFLGRLGIAVTVVPVGNMAALVAALRPNTRLIVTESPTNPFLRVVDLTALVAVARSQPGVKTVVDATFATPINQRPLAFGVDLVVHSATKYLSGHNDVLVGVVAGNAGIIQALRQAQGMLGCVVDPQAAFLLTRGLKTLALRVGRQNETALAVARLLQGHPAVAQVWYPGLPDHPDHAVARQQMRGFGGVVTFQVRPAPGESEHEAAARVMDRLAIPLIAPSLGGAESLVEMPAIMSYFDLDPADRLALGIPDNLLRLAVGIEDAADILADLDQALQPPIP